VNVMVCESMNVFVSTSFYVVRRRRCRRSYVI